MNGNHQPNKYADSNKPNRISQSLPAGKKSVSNVDKVIFIFYFMLEFTGCILLWILLAVFLVIPLGIPLLAYYLLKLTEEFMYKVLYGAEALTGADAMWMQHGPKNEAIINCLSIAEGQVDISKHKEVLERTLINAKDEKGNRLYARITKYVHAGFFSYYWMEEKNFKIEDHVRVSAKEARSKDELREALSEHCSLPLKSELSPWEYILVPWYCENGVNKIGICFRSHHSMADGVSLARYVVYELPDKRPEFIDFRKFSGRDRFLMYFKGIFWTPLFLIKMLSNRCDKNVLHGKELCGKKLLTWSDPVDLNLVKRIKNATKTTVNDVLVSCLTGALAKYFQKQGIRQPDNISVSLPVDLRKDMDRDATDFRNKFAVLQLKLPTGQEEPLSMLYETKRRMNELKVSGEPFGMGAGMGFLAAIFPEVVTKLLYDFVGRKTSAVLSNVPGPQSPIAIAGCEVKCQIFWPPQRDNIGMSLSIMSYANKVFVGVLTDEAILTEPHEICCEFEGQVVKLGDSCELLKID